MKKSVKVLICISVAVATSWVTSCTPHKFFILNSEGILSYDRNKGTFEVLWTANAKGANPDSGSVKVDSLVFQCR